MSQLIPYMHETNLKSRKTQISRLGGGDKSNNEGV